ncbi:SMP-30/gluconolactonase/LRE family protein [Polymorphobacter sp.]|uniref:SMP-30/gluconolactonase/LRE family protein n=1 Tax=Polymorphobacter sp. TaxID=1909290 RepID=UPI003F72A12F
MTYRSELKRIGQLLSMAALLAVPAGAQQAAGTATTVKRPQVQSSGMACDPVGTLSFLCGMGNAEDLVTLPGTRWIVAGGIGDRRGVPARPGLRLIDSKTLDWHHWIPEGPMAVAHDATAFPGCATPPDVKKFMAHGIAARATGPQRARLYAINHADRESIEVFDVDTGADMPRATWVGCLMPKAPLNTNSVTAAPDGTVYATVFIGPGHNIDEVFAGKPTGEVITWRPGQAESVSVPGTSLSGPNGIEISPDGNLIYVAAFGSKQVHVFDRKGKNRGIAQLGNYWPDNIRWDDQGRLVAAGMNNNDAKCVEPARLEDADPKSACYKEYVVEAVDPATLKVTPIDKAPTTLTFSHATVALIRDKVMLMGTVGADRLAYRKLD